jgi:hypothetical protein
MRRSFFPRVRREKLSSIRDNYLNAVGVAAQGANFSISAEMMRRILVDAARGWMRPGGGCGRGVDAARGARFSEARWRRGRGLRRGHRGPVAAARMTR